MTTLHSASAERKRHADAHAPVPLMLWSLHGRSLRALAPDERTALGRASDMGSHLLIMGHDGGVYDVRRPGR